MEVSQGVEADLVFVVDALLEYCSKLFGVPTGHVVVGECELPGSPLLAGRGHKRSELLDDVAGRAPLRADGEVGEGGRRGTEREIEGQSGDAIDLPDHEHV